MNEKFTPSAEEPEKVDNIEDLEKAQEQMIASEENEMAEKRPEVTNPDAMTLTEVFPGISRALMKVRADAKEKAYSIESSTKE